MCFIHFSDKPARPMLAIAQDPDSTSEHGGGREVVQGLRGTLCAIPHRLENRCVPRNHAARQTR
ncbi:protein of unknown function (plasmid) [Caballeronia sp. S22]